MHQASGTTYTGQFFVTGHAAVSKRFTCLQDWPNSRWLMRSSRGIVSRPMKLLLAALSVLLAASLSQAAGVNQTGKG